MPVRSAVSRGSTPRRPRGTAAQRRMAPEEAVVAPEPDAILLGRFASVLDRLATLDLGQRGVVGDLHRWAVDRQGDGRAFAAASALAERARPGRVVLIATGWPDRPHITPLVAETDGPPGAALLGRGLHFGLAVVPIFVVESDLVGAMAAVAEAAGLRALKPAEAIAAAASRAPLHACAVVALGTDLDAARAQAKAMFDELRPAAVIAVEKGGLNRTGHILTSRGDDTSAALAKADTLFWEAAQRGVLTIGIGDGGNEIGMGVIEAEIGAQLPYGRVGRDPAKGGIAPHTEVDQLVVAAVSNWGATAVAAALAVLTDRPEVLHPPALERAVLEAAARHSLIDGISGVVAPTADGLETEIHVAFAELAGRLVRSTIAKRRERMRL
jgi:hypothetical protein